MNIGRKAAALAVALGIGSPAAAPAAPVRASQPAASEVAERKQAPAQAPQPPQNRQQVRQAARMPSGGPAPVYFAMRYWNPPRPAYTFGQRKGGHGKQVGRGSWRTGSSARRTP